VREEGPAKEMERGGRGEDKRRGDQEEGVSEGGPGGESHEACPGPEMVCTQSPPQARSSPLPPRYTEGAQCRHEQASQVGPPLTTLI